MKRYLHLLLLLLLCSLPYGLFADVVLTDEQATELEATIDELEKVSTEQLTLIDNLKKRNSELETLCDKQKKQIDELTNSSENKTETLNEQQEALKEVKSSSTKLVIFSVLQNILIAIISGLAGFGIGFLL